VRVLIASRDLNVGGGTTYIANLTQVITRGGHAVTVLAADGPMRAALADAGAEVHCRALLFPWDGAWFRRFLRRRPVDLVNVHNRRGMELVLRPCLDAGVPLVATFHGPTRPERVRRTLQEAALIVVMNESNRDWAIAGGAPRDRVFLSRLLVDTERIAAAVQERRPDGFVVTYCSRLSGLKGPFALQVLSAADQMAASIPGLRCQVIGGGALERKVRAQAREVNRRHGREVCTVAGEQMQAGLLLAASSLVVGAGYVAAEGLAAGAYVVGVGFQGCYGLVTEANFDEAVAFNFGDNSPTRHETSPAKLAEVIHQAYELWRGKPVCALQEQARATFSLEAVGPPLMEAYRGLVRT
jgi:hypothetical protein